MQAHSDLERALQLALHAREDRIRGEQALAQLREKELQAAEALKAATSQLR